MKVLLVTLTDRYDDNLIRIAKTPQKAYEICKEFIESGEGYAEDYKEDYKEELMRDLNKSYAKYPTNFWTECTNVDMVVVEE